MAFGGVEMGSITAVETDKAINEQTAIVCCGSKVAPIGIKILAAAVVLIKLETILLMYARIIKIARMDAEPKLIAFTK